MERLAPPAILLTVTLLLGPLATEVIGAQKKQLTNNLSTEGGSCEQVNKQTNDMLAMAIIPKGWLEKLQNEKKEQDEKPKILLSDQSMLDIAKLIFKIPDIQDKKSVKLIGIMTKLGLRDSTIAVQMQTKLANKGFLDWKDVDGKFGESSIQALMACIKSMEQKQTKNTDKEASTDKPKQAEGDNTEGKDNRYEIEIPADIQQTINKILAIQNIHGLPDTKLIQYIKKLKLRGSAQAQSLQIFLIQQGFLPKGADDGYFGPSSVHALLNYHEAIQKAENQEKMDELINTTYKKITSIPDIEKLPYKKLVQQMIARQLRDTNQAQELQIFLIQQGFLPKGADDRYFGDTSIIALKDYMAAQKKSQSPEQAKNMSRQRFLSRIISIINKMPKSSKNLSKTMVKLGLRNTDLAEQAQLALVALGYLEANQVDRYFGDTSIQALARYNEEIETPRRQAIQLKIENEMGDLLSKENIQPHIIYNYLWELAGEQDFLDNKEIIIAGMKQAFEKYFKVEMSKTRGGRNAIARYKKLAEKWEPIFIKQGHPAFTSLVAYLESLVRANSTSASHAKGYFQFIKGTARKYGLKIGRKIDERKHPIKSAEAAARYIKDLKRALAYYKFCADVMEGELDTKTNTYKIQTTDVYYGKKKNSTPYILEFACDNITKKTGLPISLEAVKLFNNLSDEDDIKVGDTIKYPIGFVEPDPEQLEKDGVLELALMRYNGKLVGQLKDVYTYEEATQRYCELISTLHKFNERLEQLRPKLKKGANHQQIRQVYDEVIAMFTHIEKRFFKEPFFIKTMDLLQKGKKKASRKTILHFVFKRKGNTRMKNWFNRIIAQNFFYPIKLAAIQDAYAKNNGCRDLAQLDK